MSFAYLSSCTTNELEVKITPTEERAIANTSTNEVFDGVAQTISKVLRESSQFRRVVKTMALEKFDGDFDIMLKSLGDKTVSDMSTSRSLGGGQFRSQNFLMNSTLQPKPGQMRTY